MAETGFRSSCEVTSTKSYESDGAEISCESSSRTGNLASSTDLLLPALLVGLFTLGLGLDGADLELERPLGKPSLEIDPPLAHLHL